MRKQRPPFNSKTKPARPAAPKTDKEPTQFEIGQPAELMKFLLEKLANKGRNTVKGILSRGQVSVNGKKRPATTIPSSPATALRFSGASLPKRRNRSDCTYCMKTRTFWLSIKKRAFFRSPAETRRN